MVFIFRPRRERYSRYRRRNNYTHNPALYVTDFPKTLRVAPFKAKVKESCEPLQVRCQGQRSQLSFKVKGSLEPLSYSIADGIPVVEIMFEKCSFSNRSNKALMFRFFELTVIKQLTSNKYANQTHLLNIYCQLHTIFWKL